MEEKMTSGEIAKKAGVSQKAVRLYDKKGLLKPTDYSEGNYRLYDKEALVVLEKIVALKQIGFSLEEIKNNLEAGDMQDIRSILEKQLQMMEQKQYQLNKVIAMIKGTLERSTKELDWDDISYIVQCIDLDLKADENHWDALKHTGQELDWYVRIFKSLRLKEKEKVLDLGCGYGKLWRNNWSEIPKNTSIWGYDLHGTWADDFEEFIQEHESELPSGAAVSVHFSDIEDAAAWEQIEQEKYTCIIAHYIGDVLKDQNMLFRRVSNVLCEGGMFSFNGGGVSRWNYFFKEVLHNVGVDSSFIDARIQEQTEENKDLTARLQKHFARVDSVILPNCWHYTEADELYQKLLHMYPNAKKHLAGHENKVRESLEQLIQERGEVAVDTGTQFWHCYKEEKHAE